MPPSKKRDRDDDGERDLAPAAGASVGQQTSYIKNKLVRAEKYAKLKHKAKVRRRF